MEKKVYKDHHTRQEKIADIIRTAEPGRRILIVFWHGIGDTLMFLPLYSYVRSCFPEHSFDLALLPGVGQAEYVPHALCMPEAEFVKDHDAAFVISFPMIEGSNAMTKAEYCCQIEFGLKPIHFSLPTIDAAPNKLVGIHLQGTCLPGSTNPDEQVSQMIWDDIKNAGYVPIDLHFVHTFHNPVNKPLPWTNRNCRDLKPSLKTLQMLIERCMAVVACASGPFVMVASICRERTIYLQKHHNINCYMNDFANVIDLLAYADFNNMERSNKERVHLIELLQYAELAANAKL